jgi:hypothetical protein
MTGEVVRETKKSALLRYPDGLEMVFSNAELLRLREITSRTSDKRDQTPQRPVPIDPSLYNTCQKTIYGQVFGEEAAKDLFGDGPWLVSRQRAAARARMNSLNARRRSEKG